MFTQAQSADSDAASLAFRIGRAGPALVPVLLTAGPDSDFGELIAGEAALETVRQHGREVSKSRDP